MAYLFHIIDQRMFPRQFLSQLSSAFNIILADHNLRMAVESHSLIGTQKQKVFTEPTTILDMNLWIVVFHSVSEGILLTTVVFGSL